VAVWAGAAAITTVVGIIRRYLGARWVTDVLRGRGPRQLWLLLVLATSQTIAGRRTAAPIPS
jgi:hypothetical protein